MAFAGNFNVSQLTDLTGFLLVDTSTGTDANITDRSVALYLTNGQLLVPVIDWAIAAANPFVVTGIMTKDYSLTIVVTWISSAPITGSTYTKTLIVTFDGYDNQFAYSLVQQLAANNKTLNDNDFQGNFYTLYTEIFNAIQAAKYSDQFSAQAALDRSKYLIDNAAYFF